MRLGQLRAGVEAHELGRQPHVQPLADVARRNRVQAVLHLSMAITAYLGLCPGDDLERHRRQRQHGRLLDRLKQQQWRRVRGAVVTRSGYLQAPPLRTSVDLLQAAKRAAVQKLSRTKGTCRSTRGLSSGFADLAGSIKQPKCCASSA